MNSRVSVYKFIHPLSPKGRVTNGGIIPFGGILRASALAERMSRRVTPAGFVFMDKAITDYLAWKGTYAPRAAVSYRKWLQYFVQVTKDKRLRNYTIEDIVKYKNWLSDKYSPYCVQFAMIVLHNFFKFYRLQGKSCLSPELIKTSRAIPKSHRAITESEYRKILTVIDEPSFVALRDRLIVGLLWDTGLRVSELCDMNIEQVSRQERKAVISTKKNGQKRIIIWSEETHAVLYQYLPLRAIITSKSPLFIGVGRTRLTPRTIERMIKYYTKKAGILEKVTPHSFRHGWAHYRRDKYNAQLSFIQKGLGHRSPVSTFVYEQYSDQNFEQQAEKYL